MPVMPATGRHTEPGVGYDAIVHQQQINFISELSITRFIADAGEFFDATGTQLKDPLTDPHLTAYFAHPSQPPEHRCGIDGQRSQYRQLGLQRCPRPRIKDNLRFFPCFNQLANVQVKQWSTAGNGDAPVRHQA